MTVPAQRNEERFQSGAQEYAAYLKTPEGRLRTDLALANLQDFLPPVTQPSLSALDVGCGTGATAVRLAQLGIHVTLLDSSPAMLDIAKRVAGKQELRTRSYCNAATLHNWRTCSTLDRSM